MAPVWVKYVRGHKDRGETASLGVGAPSGGTDRKTKSFDPMIRIRKPPNFPKLFDKIGDVTARWGVPDDTWPLQKDEKQELDEFWRELVDRSADVPMLRSVLAVVSSALFLFSIIMIFAPRFYATYQALAAKGKNTDGESSGDSAGMARTAGETGASQRTPASETRQPWD